MPGNPGKLSLGAVAATPVTVLHMQYTGVSTRAGWNVCAGAVGTAGVDTEGNKHLLLGVPVVPTWLACIGARLSAAAFCAPFWGRRCSRSAWICKIVTEDASTLMLSRIWLS